MPPTDDAPSAERAPSRFNPIIAAYVVLGVVIVVAYATLAITRASAGAPIDPWIHVLVVNTALAVVFGFLERKHRRTLEELRVAVRRLGSSRKAAPSAYVDGYLDGSRQRLAGRRRTPA